MVRIRAWLGSGYGGYSYIVSECGKDQSVIRIRVWLRYIRM